MVIIKITNGRGYAGVSEKALDFKKEYKDLYMPKNIPSLINVPPMNFIMVDGAGNPVGQDFQEAVELLYSLSYTIKMSKMKGNQPQGYYEYVVPPLEGLWWLKDGEFSFEQRDNWQWTAMIRQPDFVTEEFFQWAGIESKNKKHDLQIDKARFDTFAEGPCVQMMHIGPYATEPESMEIMKLFIAENGLTDQVGSGGKHHEIYLSDPRKADPAAMKTILRHPVCK